MTQPTPYDRSNRFTGSEAGKAWAPIGPKLDTEFDDIHTTVEETLANLAIIQRDDGRIANKTVHAEALDDTVLAMLDQGAFRLNGSWSIGKVLAIGDIFESSGALYLAIAAHTATDLAADIAAKKVVGPIFDPNQVSGFTAQLASSAGAALVGANDGAGGALWTTLAGFVAKILSSGGSSVIGYTQTGTGAVSRTVQDRLREATSVKDFGATGNGSTDDTAAIQAAITAVAAAGGGTVLFPTGTYRITSGLTISAGSVFLRGPGGYAPVISAPNGVDAVAFSGSFAGGGVEGLRIVGPGYSTASSGTGIKINNAAAIVIQNVTIEGTYNGFVNQGSGAVANRLIGVDVAKVKNDAFLITGGNNTYYKNCTTFQDTGSPGGAGWRVTNSNGGPWLENCVAQQNTTGLLLKTASSGDSVFNVFATNCDFDLCANSGVTIDTATNGGKVYSVQLANCRGGFNTWAGIDISGTGSTNIMLSNCVFAKNVLQGILLTSGSGITITGGQVLGNAALGASLPGIDVAAFDNVTIIGVHSGAYPGATNNQTYGILLRASLTGYATITNCNLRGNLTGPLASSSTSTNVVIANCAGYNPVGQSSVTVGASPYTYTAGQSRETLFIRGGTVSDVKIGSTSVFVATNCTVNLEPGQSCVVTYSSIPTIVKSIA